MIVVLYSSFSVLILFSFLFFFQVNGINILETLPCTFDNLKSLKLFMDFCELPSILSVFCLLKSMPNLEELKIKVMLNTTFQTFLPTLMVALLLSTNYPFLHPIVKIYNGEVQEIELNGEFLNAQWADGMCANLEILV